MECSGLLGEDDLKGVGWGLFFFGFYEYERVKKYPKAIRKGLYIHLIH